MASSSYWKRLRDQEDDKIDKYKGWLKELKEIKDGFSKWDVKDGPSDVNSKLKKAVGNLNDAVDGCSAYNSNVNYIEDQDEASVSTDNLVSGAKSAVEREIKNVESMIDTAEEKYKEYNKRYKAAKAAERRAAEAARKAAAAASS